MVFFDKPLSQLAESDLRGLIADKEAEGKTLDYKRDLIGNGDADRKEFLYDASSFANTLGGDLVFGMEEKNGLPTDVVGVAGINPDRQISRLEQMLRDGIRPAITGVQTVAIRLAGCNVAIVMRIPKSWNPPVRAAMARTPSMEVTRERRRFFASYLWKTKAWTWRRRGSGRRCCCSR